MKLNKEHFWQYGSTRAAGNDGDGVIKGHLGHTKMFHTQGCCYLYVCACFVVPQIKLRALLCYPRALAFVIHPKPNFSFNIALLIANFSSKVLNNTMCPKGKDIPDHTPSKVGIKCWHDWTSRNEETIRLNSSILIILSVKQTP